MCGYVVAVDDRYGTIRAQCKKCGEGFVLKSNHAIIEEVGRLASRFVPDRKDCCPSLGCDNKDSVYVSANKYHRYGITKFGSPRFRCKSCLTTFSIPDPKDKIPSYRQRVHGFKNIQVFKMLVNKVPLCRICDMNSISMKTLREKIRFIYDQCVLFSAEREKRLMAMEFDTLYISVDRQDYRVNWTNRHDKRNVVLHGTGAADHRSGYILAMHLNFDPDIDPVEANRIARETGEPQTPPCFRNQARIWLPYELGQTGNRTEYYDADENVLEDVAQRYRSVMARADLDSPDVPGSDEKLPGRGVVVHSEYTLFAHFQYLSLLLPKARRTIFYLDQESPIRAAYMGAFWEKILSKDSDAFFVRINKNFTQEQKRDRLNKGKQLLREYAAAHPEYKSLKLADIRQFYIRDTLKSQISIGPWRDLWYPFPFPGMNEPEKAVCWLTDLQDRSYDSDQLAELIHKTTMHPIDNFFGWLRRRVSAFERSLRPSSRAGRVYHQYAPYRPILVEQLMEIARVYYNYVKSGDAKITPAMKLGLAKGPISVDEILYYKPT